MEVGLRPILKTMEPPPNPKAKTKAHRTVPSGVIRQKSAEAIIGADIVIGGMTIGNEPRPAYAVSIAEVSPH